MVESSKNKGKAICIRSKKREPTKFEVVLRMYIYYISPAFPIQIYTKHVSASFLKCHWLW